MEDQYNSVGPQRPSTPDRLFASLPITRILIFGSPRIKVGSRVVLPSIFPRPSKTAARQRKSDAAAAEWIDENAGKTARQKIAIPVHYNRNERRCWPGTHGWLPRNTQRPDETCCRRSIDRPFGAICQTRRDNNAAAPIDHLDCDSVARAHSHRGELGRKRVDTRGSEVSGVSDE